MNTIPIKKYFVVSLPRTGTTSLSKMAAETGLLIRHCPGPAIQHIISPNIPEFNKVEFVADTPCYVYSVISKLLTYENFKFIYCEKDLNAWVESFERNDLHIGYEDIRTNLELNSMDRNYLMEIFNGGVYSTELAKRMFRFHKQWVLNTIPEDRLLVYNFSDGWKPFCDFLEKPIPEIKLPHLNKTYRTESVSINY